MAILISTDHIGKFGLEQWPADCPLMTLSTTDPSAKDVAACADSCHEASTTCRGIIYRTSTCYNLGLTDTLCDYTKPDSTATIGYTISKFPYNICMYEMWNDFCKFNFLKS